mmetsp:Transcript_34357/g.67589  ORF Transcript_34357/g.67589 Transcript_34357/m.67589 type:complete len:115 (+) Transcript_34357:116-460(+)
MVLSSQANRAWKVAAIVGSSSTFYLAVFHTDYDMRAGPPVPIGNGKFRQQDHCFSDLHRWYRRTTDQIFFGIAARPIEQEETTTRQTPRPGVAAFVNYDAGGQVYEETRNKKPR